MQEGPRVKECPIAIQFLGTYVTVILIFVVSNLVKSLLAWPLNSIVAFQTWPLVLGDGIWTNMTPK